MNKISLLLVILLLAGCMQFAEKSEPKIIYKNNYDLKSWDLSGKISIKANNKSTSFNLDWRQRDKNLIINITNVFGFEVMRINVVESACGDLSENKCLESKSHPTDIILTISADIPAKGVYHVESLDELHDLVVSNFGFHVPFAALPYWIHAVTAPPAIAGNSSVFWRENESAIKAIVQIDHVIEYKKYQPFGDYYLPVRLKITPAFTCDGYFHLNSEGDSSDSNNCAAEIKLAIKNWQVINLK